MISFTSRKITTYQTTTPIPKNGFKAIIQNGTRYFIHVENENIINIYDGKLKSNNKQKQPLDDKNSKQIINQLQTLLEQENVNFNNEYVFEILVTLKGVIFTDIVLAQSIPNFESTSYSDRLAILPTLFPKRLNKIRILNDQAVNTIDSSLITTPTLLRPMDAFISYGFDYLVTPINPCYTYACVGLAQIPKPDIIIKREDYTSINQYSQIVKKKLVKNNENLQKLQAQPVETQIQCLNKLKTQLFQNTDDDVISFKNDQSQDVYLIGAHNNDNITIFGYAKIDNKIIDTNKIVHVAQPDNVDWQNETFKNNFTNISYFKDYHIVQCKFNNKYNKNKLSNISILSTTAVYKNDEINVNLIDKLVVNEKSKNVNTNISNVTDNEIYTETIKRLSQNVIETNNIEIKKILETLKDRCNYNSKINEQFKTLIELLEDHDSKIVDEIIYPLINQINDPNNIIFYTVKKNLNKLKRSNQESINDDYAYSFKKMKYDDL